MYPAIRNQRSVIHQSDYDTPLDASYIRGHPERGAMARQEDRDETDLNTIVARFGLTGNAPPQKVARWGVALDDDADLQTLYIMRADAQRAFHQMPKDVREKYKNWHAMLDAIHTGELKVKEIGAEPPTPVPPTEETKP